MKDAFLNFYLHLGVIPLWDTEIRFRVGLVNCAFLQFEVKNFNKLIGYNVIPARRLLYGLRYIRLYDKNQKLIPGAKLFVHMRLKTIADCWSPNTSVDRKDSQSSECEEKTEKQ